MRYKNISNALFSKNRERISKHLSNNSLAILHSNDLFPTNADGNHPFKQNSDLFYLTGIDQENVSLLLFPNAKEEKHKEILFLPKSSKLSEIWDGKKLSKEEATEISGITTVFWTEQLDQTLHNLLLEAKSIYLPTNEHQRASCLIKTKNDRFIKECKNKYPLHEYQRLAPILHSLRMEKQDAEVNQIRKACDITEAGFRRACSQINPNKYEYEIEAEYSYEFLKAGSRGFAYQPIIASGKNSCVLHYIDNDQLMKDGDILLMDVGAEYGNYNADMTRTVPVNGKYSSRQKEIYQAVLRIMRVAEKALTPGKSLTDYHKEIGLHTEKELVNLGLITTQEIKDQNPENAAYKKYFMHGTSHHLGLDVHDVHTTDKMIELDHVYTIEPGIYVPEEKVGVRIENNYWVQEKQNLNLMESIPIEIEEIEDIMNL